MDTTLVSLKSGLKYDICICRPSKFGNPFTHKVNTIAKFKVKSRKEAVSSFEVYFYNNLELQEAARKELQGKVIACACDDKFIKEGLCHGTIYVKFLNQKRNSII